MDFHQNCINTVCQHADATQYQNVLCQTASILNLILGFSALEVDFQRL